MKKLSKSKLVLIIAVALMLISMVGTACMQGNWGKTQVKTYYVSLNELQDMIRENNAETGKDIQITFSGSDAQLSFMTLIPKTATAEHPAPAIICAHGGANTKEMQMPGYIELARRGFVVITIDMSEHGYSDAATMGATLDSYGMLAAVEYAMSLPCVKEDCIGVTGHSQGNSACYGTIQELNTEGSTQRIAAWVEGAGSMPAVLITPEEVRGMIWTVSVDHYDEFDSVYFDSPHILTNDNGKTIIRGVYPGYNDDAIVDGQWYDPNGPIEAPKPGEALEAETAVRLLNPPITHPMFHFTLTGTKITVDGFYAAFGTPDGAKYIPSSNQVWPVTVCFELLGLIGFFMMIFPLVALLKDTKLFAGITRKVPARDELSATLDLKEGIIWALTLVASVIFAFFSYKKLYPAGDALLNPAIYAANGVANGIGIWTLACGAFAVVVTVLSFLLRKILARGKEVSNPFAPAALDSLKQFFLTALFGITVVVLMFIPVYIARYVFNADFRICSFIVMAGEISELPLVLCKYVPIWLCFYIPNAITLAATRYKNVPDWVTALVCAVANSLALIIFVIKQYGTLFRTGFLWDPNGGMAGIVAFPIIFCLFFAAFSARYVYKKTGNIWAAGFINGTVMCCSTLFATSFPTDFVLTF